jgi:hypothetical protein
MKIALAAVVVALSAISFSYGDSTPELAFYDLSAQGTIQGFITDEAGQSLPNAIIVFISEGEGLTDSVISGISGQFSMELPAGSYRISAWVEGFVKEYYPNAYFYDNSNPVILFSKQILQVLIGLKRGALISGAINTNCNNANKLIVSAIKIDNPYINWQCERQVVINGSGQYQLSGLLAGHYKVYIRGNGYQTQYYPMVQFYNEAAVILVSDGQLIEGIDFDLIQPALSLVRGRVTDSGTGRPLNGISIYASQWSPGNNDPGSCMAITDINGDYEFEAVTGEYVVSAAFNTAQLTNDGFRIYYDGRFSPDLADIVTVRSGQVCNDINININLLKNYNLEITGSLYNQRDGAPIVGAKLIAIDYLTGRALSSGSTRDAGDFLIGNLSDGSYLIQMNGANLIPAFWPGVWGWQQAEQIRLSGASVDLYNGGAITQDYGTPGLSISGRIESPESPLAGVRVYAINVGNDMVAFGKTDNFGSYSLASGLTEGAYNVFADLIGFEGAYYPGIVALDLLESPHVDNINIMLMPAVVGINSNVILPQKDHLFANYPNPFNGGTTILFESKSSGQMDLDIYDIAGRLCRRISTLVNPGMNGIYWNGRDDSGAPVASGVYFYRVAGANLVKKMSLIK